MNSPRLRPMHWRDIDQLVELERTLFADDAWTERTWWSELAGRPRRAYWVAVDGAAPGPLLGYAGIDHGGDVADVMTIATAPGAQGRGVGRMLLDRLVADAADRGAEALLLEVRADNDRARDLYARNGFTEINRRRGYYPGGVDALVMRRLLRGR